MFKFVSVRVTVASSCSIAKSCTCVSELAPLIWRKGNVMRDSPDNRQDRSAAPTSSASVLVPYWSHSGGILDIFSPALRNLPLHVDGLLARHVQRFGRKSRRQYQALRAHDLRDYRVHGRGQN